MCVENGETSFSAHYAAHLYCSRVSSLTPGSCMSAIRMSVYGKAHARYRRKDMFYAQTFGGCQHVIHTGCVFPEFARRVDCSVCCRSRTQGRRFLNTERRNPPPAEQAPETTTGEVRVLNAGLAKVGADAATAVALVAEREPSQTWREHRSTLFA